MRRVLVVDDVRSMRDFLAFSLAAIPELEIDQAADGMRALQLLQEHRYNCVLLDLNLPLLDGMKILSMMRQRDDTQHTPVVVITTDATEETAKRVLDLGAREILRKPVRAEVVIDAVRGGLGLPPERQQRHAEKRKARRVRIPVVVSLPGQPPKPATTWDINPYGAFVATDEVVPVGSQIHLNLEIEHQEPLAVAAKVVHARPRAFGPLPAGMGVAFLDEDRDTVKRLEQAFVSPFPPK